VSHSSAPKTYLDEGLPPIKQQEHRVQPLCMWAKARHLSSGGTSLAAAPSCTEESHPLVTLQQSDQNRQSSTVQKTQNYSAPKVQSSFGQSKKQSKQSA